MRSAFILLSFLPRYYIPDRISYVRVSRICAVAWARVGGDDGEGPIRAGATLDSEAVAVEAERVGE